MHHSMRHTETPFGRGAACMADAPLLEPRTPDRNVEFLIEKLAHRTSEVAVRSGLAYDEWVQLLKPCGFALRSLDRCDAEEAARHMLGFVQGIVARAPEPIRGGHARELISNAGRIRSLLGCQDAVASSQPLTA